MAKLENYENQKVKLIGLNMALDEGVRRDVYVIIMPGQGYAVAAFGELDVMFFNSADSYSYWNSNTAKPYRTISEAQVDFNRWYYGSATRELA